MPRATGDQRQEQSARIESLADYAGYLLENECGLPKNEALWASAAALREIITELLERGEVSEPEMQFMIAQAIDIMPNQDLAGAARAQGFPAESVDKIERAHRSVLEAMKARREAL